MAKTKRRKGGESISGYFRQIFADNPQWLKNKSNADVIARYDADHPGNAADSRIRANLANIKSTLRREQRAGKFGKAKSARVGPKVEMESANANPDAPLEALELAIDDCMTLAKNVDRSGLGKVIDHLRAARNLVVWKLGQ